MTASDDESRRLSDEAAAAHPARQAALRARAELRAHALLEQTPSRGRLRLVTRDAARDERREAVVLGAVSLVIAALVVAVGMWILT